MVEHSKSETQPMFTPAEYLLFLWLSTCNVCALSALRVIYTVAAYNKNYSFGTRHMLLAQCIRIGHVHGLLYTIHIFLMCLSMSG